jgi:hypothetical protein
MSETTGARIAPSLELHRNLVAVRTVIPRNVRYVGIIAALGST